LPVAARGYSPSVTDSPCCQAVLLDIDGTLVDSNFAHVVTWAQAFAEFDAPVDAWRILHAIGMDSALLLETLLPDADDELRERAKQRHSEHYLAIAPGLRRLTGARELLSASAAAGLRVVLATSAPDDELAVLRRILGADDLVDAVTSSADVDTAKPRPDVIGVALERAGVPADRAVFVGDTVWDARACVRAGVPFVGVRTGGIDAESLRRAGAVAVFDDPADLLAHADRTPIGALHGAGSPQERSSRDRPSRLPR
jgi:HAD superfamily hydrolase (TIGR01509 family)